MKNNLHNQGENRKPLFNRNYLAISILFLLFFCINIHTTAKASSVSGSSITVKINYLEEIATLSPGSGNSTKFYISLDKMKTWELIEPYGMMDISALLQAKSVELYFKGNKDANPVPVTLQGEENSLKVTYQIVGGEGRAVITNTTLPIEYRKGNNGAWKTASYSMSTTIYEIKGATLYFRTIATESKRAGKIVTFKVPKRPSAPSVKLDGSKLCITGMKSGEMLYRIGDSTSWVPYATNDPKIKYLDLKSLFGSSLPANTPIPAGMIEFRTGPTDKKAASAVKVIEITQQPTVPDTISLSGTTLTILDSDKKRAYEYTIVKKNTSLNLQTARWTSVTSAKSVVIKGVEVGDKILVRLKSRTDSTTKQLILASTYKELPVTSILN
ncbi:MAG: hypothetical protein K0S47_4217 [Herbinix sp.]|jgi:hypothetical protein|nr:hypothetical protein [Herbinix sp.]